MKKHYFAFLSLLLCVLIYAGCKKEDPHPYPGTYESSGQQDGLSINHFEFLPNFAGEDSVRVKAILDGARGDETYSWTVVGPNGDKDYSTEELKIPIEEIYVGSTKAQLYVENSNGDSDFEVVWLYRPLIKKAIFQRIDPIQGEELSLNLIWRSTSGSGQQTYTKTIFANPNQVSGFATCNTTESTIELNVNMAYFELPYDGSYEYVVTSNIPNEGPWADTLGELNYYDCRVIDLN